MGTVRVAINIILYYIKNCFKAKMNKLKDDIDDAPPGYDDIYQGETELLADKTPLIPEIDDAKEKEAANDKDEEKFYYAVDYDEEDDSDDDEYSECESVLLTNGVEGELCIICCTIL